MADESAKTNDRRSAEGSDVDLSSESPRKTLEKRTHKRRKPSDSASSSKRSHVISSSDEEDEPSARKFRGFKAIFDSESEKPKKRKRAKPQNAVLPQWLHQNTPPGPWQMPYNYFWPGPNQAMMNMAPNDAQGATSSHDEDEASDFTESEDSEAESQTQSVVPQAQAAVPNVDKPSGLQVSLTKHVSI